MSTHDLVDRLIRLLDSQAAGLDKLRAAMQDGRTAWLALRPTELQSSVDQLQELADGNAALEQERRAVLSELGALLGIPDNATVSRLSSRLPAPLAARLRTAAGRASRAAHAVRQENGMGARLLEFSRHSQESMFRSIRELGDDQARSYDRNAKAVVQSRAVGSFVDGKL